MKEYENLIASGRCQDIQDKHLQIIEKISKDTKSLDISGSKVTNI